jgi:hypothetical protein
MPALSRRSLAGAAATLAALGGQSAAAANPDARLIGLCVAYQAHDAAMNALTDPWMDTPGGWPASLLAECDVLAPHGHAHQAAIAATPARTMAGCRAKAAFVLDQYSYFEDGSPDEGDAVACSLARDVLALAGKVAV